MDSRNKACDFLFNADWMFEDDFQEQVQIGWKEEIRRLPNKLVGLGKHLQKWAYETRLKRERMKRELLDDLEKLSKEYPKQETLASIIKVKLAL